MYTQKLNAYQYVVVVVYSLTLGSATSYLIVDCAVGHDCPGQIGSS